VSTTGRPVRSAPQTVRVAAALLRETATRWVDDRCYRLGASLAYYALFSLFPLLLLSVTVLGFALGDGAATRTQLLDSVTGATGEPEMRALLDQTLTSMQDHRAARGIGAIVGLVTLVFGASGVFSELSSSLNTIWRVREPDERTVWQSVVSFLRDKALSFGLVALAGLLLLVSLVLSTALAAASDAIHVAPLVASVEVVVSMLFMTAAIAGMYHALPQTSVAWRDTLPGALVAALLLTILKRLMAWYLAHVGSYAAYGAVGAVLGLLLLIYVSSLVVFFGAELSRVYAERFGSLKAAQRGPAAAHTVQHDGYSPIHRKEHTP
jgi:membrane protein